jgi:hypothetical protein
MGAYNREIAQAKDALEIQHGPAPSGIGARCLRRPTPVGCAIGGGESRSGASGVGL